MGPLMIGGLFDVAGKLIDRLLPDEAARTEAQANLAQMQMNGELQELQIQMSAITAEASSADPWTSRARPAFLYVFYVILAVMVIVAPMIGLRFPDLMDLYYMNVAKGFAAIPTEVWWTFTTGYLGYGGLRTLEKVKKV
jgi:hypothetical protein